jgi:hypothetical protein
LHPQNTIEYEKEDYHEEYDEEHLRGRACYFFKHSVSTLEGRVRHPKKKASRAKIVCNQKYLEDRYVVVFVCVLNG